MSTENKDQNEKRASHDPKKVKKVLSNKSEQRTYTDDRITPQIVAKKGYHLRELLAKGSFSEVYKGFYADKETGEINPIAIKVINREKVDKDWETIRLPVELKVAKQINHPHVIKYIGVPIKTPHRAFIFMELCMEEIGKLLDGYPNGFPEKHCQTWFQQLVTALCYLQKSGIAHRDLKTENILLDSALNVKLTDFSFAFFCYDHRTRKELLADTFCGTKGYKAPELYKGSPYDAIKADVWSAGATLYELMFHRLPFPIDETKMDGNLILKILNYKKYNVDKKILGPREAPVTNEFKVLIRALLEPDPDLRITQQKIIRDQWFTLKLDAPPIVLHRNSKNK